jgi:putative hydrolase of the HAD superfamily
VIKAIFTDLGGVVLTNGWDHDGRHRAVEHFGMDLVEFAKRHEMVFGDYEEGRMTLDEYLTFAVFHCHRPFSRAEFVNYMKELSQFFPESIYDTLKAIKAKYGLPIFALSNEGRELGEYRNEKFELREVIDAFIVSGFERMRKPSMGIYKMTLDLAQTPAEQTLYIDDREVLIEAGNRAGLMTLWHKSREETVREFARHGLIL